MLDLNSHTLGNIPEEIVTAHEYLTVMEDGRRYFWAVSNEDEAKAKASNLGIVKSVEFIKDLTNHMAWLTHPDGYMYGY